MKWAEEVLKRTRSTAANDTLEIGGGALHSFVDLEGNQFPGNPVSLSDISTDSRIDVVYQTSMSSLACTQSNPGSLRSTKEHSISVGTQTTSAMISHGDCEDSEAERLAAIWQIL